MGLVFRCLHWLASERTMSSNTMYEAGMGCSSKGSISAIKCRGAMEQNVSHSMHHISVQIYYNCC